MATYDYKCLHGHVTEITQSVYRPLHKTINCATCTKKAHRVYTAPMISPSATPTRSPSVAGLKAQERQVALDYEAVKKMARAGIVPKSSVGAHQAWSQAEDRLEIETGHKFNNLEAAKEIAEELKTPKPMSEVRAIAKENANFIKESVL